ncbi:beta strand repeat-containing protein [Persicimonas caeni]|uniref:beta strand repeat-containing protein n=1 Tax=Persicimonas caeni TaxID=2292766 RepID=UPI00143DDD72|nr:Calx-beta domain-containing protein [Persicimonas caeni]
MVVALVQAAAFWTGCSDDDDKTEEPLTLSELVEVGEPSGKTSEAGAQATFSVALKEKPSADVVLQVASSDPGEGEVDRATLTFTPDNWDAPQTVTVTGQDDDLADGEQAYQVVFEAMESDDERFAGLQPPSVALANVDDETAGFTVSEASGDTTEAGGQASFTLVLNSQPTADVVVSLESSDAEEGTPDRSSLTFTPDNWNAPQTVTVTGQDDDLADGPQAYQVVFGETSSDDADYAAIAPEAVDFTNVDDETAGITVSEASGDTTEAGGQASFTVVLNSQPEADVTLSLASSDPGEGTADKTALTFTADNWNAPQTVTVTGQDDDLADGNQAYEILFEETTSADADYAAISPEAVAFANVDDETPGITVQVLDATTTEGGGQAVFSVVLNSKPAAAVSLGFAVDAPEEASLGTSELTFTPDNWNAPQTVLVTGLDDEIADGDQPFGVVFEASASDDADYAGLTPQNLALTNVDDDSAGFTVSPMSGPTTEAGGQATFAVVLNSEPTDDVTLSFDSSDLGEGVLDRTELTFTVQNWNAPQAVIVTGQDDDLADGDQPYAIAFSATTSNDARYAALTPQNVAVSNTDDDSAGITVSDISGDTSEAGAQASFTVVLNSEPFEDVTINLDSGALGEGLVDKTALTFTAQNWNAPQTVTVTGQDDDRADGDQPYSIVFAATTSNDAAYAAITPQNVAVTNTDDDSAGITVSAVSGATTEAGGQASFTVVLNSEPFEDVTVNLDSAGADEGTVDKTTLTFTAQNWNAPQTVTITGQNDDYADGDQPYDIVFSATTSNDAAYAAITPQNVAVTNTDDDSAGITVSAISGPTGEAGGQATFTVVLNSRPYGDVALSFESSDAGEGSLDKASLTFTDANWNAPQTVTLTGQDDDLADGDQPYSVVFDPTSSQDPAYDALSLQNVAVSNVDDDSAGITVSAVSGPTSEAGGQATFTIVLNSEPYEDVTLNFGSNERGEGVLDKTSLTFTAQNWNAPQTVTLTGQDDEYADGDQPYAVAFLPALSQDAAYNGLTPQNVAVTNTDNDSAGITVSAVSGATSEAGGQASFTVVLNSRPYGDVTVNFDSSDAGEGSLDTTSLTFTDQNWNAPQTATLTGQNDDLADGDQPYAVTFAATTSQDAAYAAITPQNVAVTNTDDDSAGITVGAISGATSEAGGQATFTVVLNSEPFEDVIVNLDSASADEGTVDKTALTFTAQNWNAPQTVTVTGQDDFLADGDQPYAIAFSATTSQDAAYAAITPQNVAVTNTDDDSAGITVSAVSGSTSEAGGQATFTVVLNSQPFEDVTVNYASTDTSEGTVGNGSLTFTDQNWNAPQTVTVTGQDDFLADGDQPYAIAFSATTSQDAAYAAITPQNVAVQNTDDDSAGITVSAISGSTSEAGGQASFTVALNSRPYADVTVSFASSDAGEGSLDKTTLTFTDQNWNAPQTVTLTGQDDLLADGDQPYSVVFSATTSGDPAYAAITPQNVAVTNTDDDSAGITVTLVDGTTGEDNAQGSFAVVLNSQPYADVTVNFASNDAGEGIAATSSLTFTDQNWNAPQQVTVVGQNDAFADGDQPYAIAFSATTSGDAAYAAITPQNVAFTNVDDDSAGITVGAISGPTSEAGGQATFSVVLNSRPFADVVVNLDSNNPAEGTVDQTSLTFTDADWDTPQTVTVAGQDDFLADGDQPYAIAFTATTSGDAAYAAITPQNVAVTNTDDDSAGITVGAISGPTSEAGGQATFTVVLNSEPYDTVTLTLGSNDSTEGLVDQTSLTFTSADWNTPQTVTITGQDDFVADGDQPYAVTFGASSSNDAAYAGITPQNVAVTNTDNDSASIQVSAISNDTSESGGQATFTVVLTSRPLADVTVGFDSNDLTEGTVSVTQLTFTSADWDTPQVVTVTGVDDPDSDGPQAYGIAFVPTVSGDAAYNGLTPATVAVTNADDEWVDITGSTVGWGHHGSCTSFNGCGDAATCALWACQAEGFSSLYSYGRVSTCESGGFTTCHLFSSQTSVDYNWGPWSGGGCDIPVVSEIRCLQ